jgi:hypothetical protein
MWRLLTIVAVLMLLAGRSVAGEYEVSPRARAHWAWAPPRRPAVPAVKDAAWCRTPIDRFILARLEAEGLAPAAPAAPETLLRRIEFDLVGLPPTPDEVERARNDKSDERYEKLVDLLLASPHYGERWGRHWLDVARYAESNGYEYDEHRPDAWRYRDYVVRCFNANKPYDRFIREQIAGDELWPDDADALIATGFALLGPDMTDAASQVQRRQNTLNDMTDTTALAFLGLTLACARCHDHKFEPIPITDYYRFEAFFTPAAFRKDLPLASSAEKAAHAAQMKEYEERIRPLTEERKKLEEPYRQKLHEAKLAKLSDEARAAHRTPPEKRTAAQKQAVEITNRLLVVAPADIAKAMTAEDRAKDAVLQKRLKEFDAFLPRPMPVAMGLQKQSSSARTKVLERGELSAPGSDVAAGVPLILSPSLRPADARMEGSPGPRTVLAEWIADPRNPLTARVIVNRVWQHHFGRGLVATASDFGLRGEPPTHPELLDWLAVEFMESGWDIKALHRLILTSTVYRQSTHGSDEARRKDPDNLLLARMNRLRLEGEIIRDTLLATSGRLNLTVGGPSVFPPLPPEVRLGAATWKPSLDPRDHVRRSVYISARRNLRFPFLEAFDLPDSNLSCPRRERSTSAPQALALLNASDVVEAAQALAKRVEAEATTPEERVRRVYLWALGRTPTDGETKRAVEFLTASPLSELCRALMNVNEFVYLD